MVSRAWGISLCALSFAAKPQSSVGGAFPIRVGDAWVATLAVSGLHEGKDHELCVRALARALGRALDEEVPVYRYPAI